MSIFLIPKLEKGNHNLQYKLHVYVNYTVIGTIIYSVKCKSILEGLVYNNYRNQLFKSKLF